MKAPIIVDEGIKQAEADAGISSQPRHGGAVQKDDHAASSKADGADSAPDEGESYIVQYNVLKSAEPFRTVLVQRPPYSVPYL